MSKKIVYNDTMLIIGHRGAAGLAPENTMAAIAAGIEAGSDMIEIDVRLTRDNQLVVIHDPRLVRTHRSRESISNLPYDGLIARSGDRPIPLLEQVLDAYFGKVLFNIVAVDDGGQTLGQLARPIADGGNIARHRAVGERSGVAEAVNVVETGQLALKLEQRTQIG